MARMFLGTSFLFAILHSKIGLLTNALSDKSLVLRGRAKVGEERSKMGVNRRQTNDKAACRSHGKQWYLLTLPFAWILSQSQFKLSLLLSGGDLQKPRTCLPFLSLVPSLASSALCLCHDYTELAGVLQPEQSIHRNISKSLAEISPPSSYVNHFRDFAIVTEALLL